MCINIHQKLTVAKKKKLHMDTLNQKASMTRT